MDVLCDIGIRRFMLPDTLGIMNLIPIIPNVIALVWIMRKSKAQEALVHMRKRYETL